MKNLIFILFIATTLMSCNDLKVDSPDDFMITANVAASAGDTLVIKANDTLVFTMSGNPDYITFYSGLAGSNYDYANVSQRSADSAVVSFSTNIGAGNQGSLLCMASNDFGGNMNADSIKKATWVDVSSNFKFATTSTTVVSGNLNLNNVVGIAKNAPVYIAFKYMSDTVTSATTMPRKWIVNAFSFKSYMTGSANVLANDFRSGGFQTTNVKNSNNYWQYANASLTFAVNSNLLMPVTTSPDEDWAISRSLDMRAKTNDVGVVIKSLENTGVISNVYSFQYTTKGFYKATFVARNQKYDDYKQVVRQLLVKVQ